MSADFTLNIEMYENVFAVSADLFQRLEDEVVYLPAEKSKVTVRGKEYAVSRQIAAYGDDNLTYCFSGLTVHCQPWTPLFHEIKNHVENITGARYNFREIVCSSRACQHNICRSRGQRPGFRIKIIVRRILFRVLQR